MQTFLPYPSFVDSVKCLDGKRLNKQKVEAYQIYKCLKDIPRKDGKPYKGWKNHPIVKMWKGYESALALYLNACIDECINRGYKNTIDKIQVIDIIYPSWFGNESFHASHRSNLLRKNKEYYCKYNWSESDNLPYVWFT